jgi:hypothetical protein
MGWVTIAALASLKHVHGNRTGESFTRSRAMSRPLTKVEGVNKCANKMVG